MEIGIQNWIVRLYNDEKKITALSKAGFKCYDWDLFRYYNNGFHKDEPSSAVRRHHKALKNVLDGEGARVTHTHAPFPTYYDCASKEKILGRLERAFEATAELGSHCAVVHPQMPTFLEKPDLRAERVKLNIDYYNEIKTFSERYDVKIALENMIGSPSVSGGYNITAFSTADELLEVFNALNDRKHFCICYDCGHANVVLKDRCAEMLNEFGGDVEVLHLHDNYGRFDNHNLPFNGNIRWDKIFEALKNIGFDGVYNFEIAPAAVKGFLKTAKLKKVYEHLFSFVSQFANE